jgi:hypothetical protein
MLHPTVVSPNMMRRTRQLKTLAPQEVRIEEDSKDLP